MSIRRQASPNSSTAHAEALRHERLRQMRGLLALAGLILLLVLLRADRAAIFHDGWWRL